MKFYLANAIPYTNAKPHIGHFLEFVLSDAIARYHRLKGEEVYFGLGSDENGQKMWQAARDAGRDTLEFATENSEYFQNLKEVIGISYDGFVRTTSEEHKKASQAMWERLDASGDLYKKKYKGLYCVGCESFKTEKDLVDGFCPNHPGKPLKEVEEENYFFKMSKYQEQLKKLIESDELRIIPSFRKNELLNFIDSGLEDVSFSRPKSALPWGIDVPNDPDHVMYVWCDALTNYMTHTGFPEPGFEKLHPVDLHMIGKDITRFHALIYQAMLMSAGLQTSKAIYVHEFVTMNGQKMSKSVGNVVDPYEIMEKYGSEALRFYLLSEAVQGNDLDFTWERFHAVYESKLQKGIGNLVNRVISLIERYDEGILKPRNMEVSNAYFLKFAQEKSDIEWYDAEAILPEYEKHMRNFDFSASISAFMLLLDNTNNFLTKTEPWKTDDAEWRSVILNLCSKNIINIAKALEPIIPKTTQKILQAFNMENSPDPFTGNTESIKVSKIDILFPPVIPHE